MTERGFDIVVAADLERGIARNGVIPWRLRGDLAHFKNLTKKTADPKRQNAVIMGRATWESLPSPYRPLPGRQNWLLSRHTSLVLPAGVYRATGLHDALERLASAGRGDDGTGVPTSAAVERIFVIGGGAVYAEAVGMAECRRIYYTRIAARCACDVFFPPFEHRFCRENVLAEAAEHGISYRIEVWRNPLLDAGP